MKLTEIKRQKTGDNSKKKPLTDLEQLALEISGEAGVHGLPEGVDTFDSDDDGFIVIMESHGESDCTDTGVTSGCSDAESQFSGVSVKDEPMESVATTSKGSASTTLKGRHTSGSRSSKNASPTEELLDIEKAKLQIERDRLSIKKERLDLEKRKVDILQNIERHLAYQQGTNNSSFLAEMQPFPSTSFTASNPQIKGGGSNQGNDSPRYFSL